MQCNGVIPPENASLLEDNLNASVIFRCASTSVGVYMYIIQAFGTPFFPGSSFGPFLFCDLDLCRGLTTD